MFVESGDSGRPTQTAELARGSAGSEGCYGDGEARSRVLAKPLFEPGRLLFWCCQYHDFVGGEYAQGVFDCLKRINVANVWLRLLVYRL